VTRNSSAFFYNVPPGDYIVRLLPPDRVPVASLDCELDPFATGFSFGVSAGERNAYRIRVVPGFSNLAARAFCAVR
jgi:hypothetical protein